MAHVSSYDVILLDWNLPHIDGLRVCRMLRDGKQAAPVLMLTVRSDRDDQVRALEAGADDYLTKPYDLEILFARIRALARRGHLDAEQSLQVGAVTIRPRDHAAYVDGTPVSLTQKQYALLSYLAHRAGQIVTREELLAKVWTLNTDPGSNVVDVQIGHLRSKLGHARGQIKTVRGVGYLLSL
jgi:two-component system OmpR family response regulator